MKDSCFNSEPENRRSPASQHLPSVIACLCNTQRITVHEINKNNVKNKAVFVPVKMKNSCAVRFGLISHIEPISTHVICVMTGEVFS